jgi:lysophospholipase L1-like esterase
MFVHAAKLALAPVLYAQARRVRASALELPEPHGPREGVEGDGAERFRLLVTGDSSAAGVGARSQDEALVRPLARALAHRLDGSVRWQLLARTGLTSQGVLDLLQHGHVHPADAAVVVVGVNDVTNEVPLRLALRQRARIVQWLRTGAQVKSVWFTSMPEMQHFPALPQPLAWYAGLHARRNNAAQARWARSVRGAAHVDLSGLVRRDWMAEDGYHPAPPLYAKLAERLADALVAG